MKEYKVVFDWTYRDPNSEIKTIQLPFVVTDKKIEYVGTIPDLQIWGISYVIGMSDEEVKEFSKVIENCNNDPKKVIIWWFTKQLGVSKEEIKQSMMKKAVDRYCKKVIEKSDMEAAKEIEIIFRSMNNDTEKIYNWLKDNKKI